jgi:PST family polysaccharide transporter
MEGMEAAGFYQAAWTLGGLYVGFILQAMGADFYPRLVGVSRDNSQCNRLVNEQAHVSLLLAGPGVLATLTFAPIVINLFYTAKFSEAVEVLRWICLGMGLRVITWPMGFIVVAKNQRLIFLGVEFAWTVINISLAWLCVSSFGLAGAGIAFFGSYVFHGFIIYAVVRQLSGFRWSSASMRTAVLYLLLGGSVFCGFYLLPPMLAMVAGAVAMVVSAVYSIRVLCSLVSTDQLPDRVRRLLIRFRLIRAQSTP